MKIKSLIFSASIILSALLAFECNNVFNNIHSPEGELIDANILPMSHHAQSNERGIFKLDSVPGTCSGCSFRQIMGFINISHLPVFTPSVWPGMLINPANMLDGDYTPINSARNSLTIEFPGQRIPRSGITATQEAVDHEIAYYAGNRFIDDSTKPAVYMKIEDVYSLEQLGVIMGAHLGVSEAGRGLSPYGQFDFSAAGKARILVSLVYVYFDAQVTGVNKPHDVFGDSAKWAELEPQLAEKISPVYVAGVEYGQAAYLFVEVSTGALNIDELHSTLLNLLNDRTTPGDRTLLDNPALSIRMLFFGNGNLLLQPKSKYEDLVNFLNQLKNNTGKSLDICVPVRYTLKYLNDIGNYLDLVLSGNFCSPVCDLKPILTVNFVDENGRKQSEGRPVSSSETINLETIPSYIDPSTKETMNFSSWSIETGSCSISDRSHPTTTATGITERCTITAMYTIQNPTMAPTPVSTVGSTTVPTAVPVDTPPPPVDTPTPPPPANTPLPSTDTPPPPIDTPTPVPTAVPTYTVTINHIVYGSGTGSGTCIPETYKMTSLAGGSVGINTDSQVICNTSPMVIETFSYWSVSGAAVIDNPTSTSATVTNIQSNVTVTANYD